MPISYHKLVPILPYAGFFHTNACMLIQIRTRVWQKKEWSFLCVSYLTVVPVLRFQTYSKKKANSKVRTILEIRQKNVSLSTILLNECKSQSNGIHQRTFSPIGLVCSYRGNWSDNVASCIPEGTTFWNNVYQVCYPINFVSLTNDALPRVI